MVDGAAERQGRLRRVVTRPFPWLLRYLISTLPALLLAPLVMLPLRSLFRYPILTEALKTGSLDLVLELLNHPPSKSLIPPTLVWVLLLIPLAWLVVRVVWLWTEGGVLVTYARDERITVRRFVQACTSWFGPFVLLGLLSGLAIGLLVGMTTVVAVLATALWRLLTVPVLVVGAVFVVGCWVWFELARVNAVVHGDRHVLRALGRATKVARRQAAPLVVLVLGVLVVRVALAVGSNALLSALSFSWWLPVLVIQQGVQILAVGLALSRRAGQVELTLRAMPAAEPAAQAELAQYGAAEADG